MKDLGSSVALIAVLVAVLLAGCAPAEQETGQSAEPAAEAAEQAAEQVPVSMDEAAMKAVLTYADAADGNEDGVVSKCAGCALAMDGKVEHTVQYEGYEFHLCSDHCQKSFEESAEAVLAKLEMPEEQAAPAE